MDRGRRTRLRPGGAHRRRHARAGGRGLRQVHRRGQPRAGLHPAGEDSAPGEDVRVAAPPVRPRVRPTMRSLLVIPVVVLLLAAVGTLAHAASGPGEPQSWAVDSSTTGVLVEDHRAPLVELRLVLPVGVWSAWPPGPTSSSRRGTCSSGIRGVSCARAPTAWRPTSRSAPTPTRSCSPWVPQGGSRQRAGPGARHPRQPRLRRARDRAPEPDERDRLEGRSAEPGLHAGPDRATPAVARERPARLAAEAVADRDRCGPPGGGARLAPPAPGALRRLRGRSDAGGGRAMGGRPAASGDEPPRALLESGLKPVRPAGSDPARKSFVCHD